MEEVQKIRGIFNDSRENFSHMCSKLHEDFTHKVGLLADKSSTIDEVRNLYEMQIEVHKEDMKRLDLKTERAIRELEKEKRRMKVDMERNEEHTNQRMM